MTEDEAERAFFGRRKGPKLRPGQARLVDGLLPKLRLPAEGQIALAGLFGRPMREYRLEIGFGGGEHLLAAAAAERDIGFIGCEPFVNGLAKCLAGIEAGGLDNLRLWDDDAAALLQRLPAGGFAQIDLFYPDPWPKRRQRKRRFVSDETLRAIARLLEPGGCFRFATDIDDYAGWTLARLLRSPDLDWTAERAADWTTPHRGWVRTRYEAKAIAAGRKPSYVLARRVR